VYCRDATAMSCVVKIRDEVFVQFYAVVVKCHSIMQNWQFGLPGRFLWEQSPWCQRKWWGRSWLCSLPVSHFSVSINLDSRFTAHAFFPARVPVVLVPKFTQYLMPFLCWIHREIASGQIHDSKYKDVQNQYVHLAAWKFVHLLPKYASTTTYRCIWLL
jgi:hypothetical protein